MADKAPLAPIDFVWFFFRLTGRVSRMPFFLSGMLLQIAVTFPIYQFSRFPPDSSGAQAWALAVLLVVVPVIWSSIALGVKRLHDMEKPGMAAISLFVPVISIIAFVVLCFFPGTPGPNSYGEQTNAPA